MRSLIICFFILSSLFFSSLTSAVTPMVKAGDNHSLALKSDGTVVAWGNNYYGQSTVPTGLNDVVAVEAGAYHSLALKSNGTVVAWGYNGEGETKVPAGLTGVVAITAGNYHSLALKSDGSVVGWGYNGQGQTTVPSGLSNVVAIGSGAYHSLAFKTDGTVSAWGNNVYGQTTVPEQLKSVPIPTTPTCTAPQVLQNNVCVTPAPTVSYKIGDKGPAGGIVFTVDNTGSHGLEAQPADYGNGSNWSNAITAGSSYGSGWHLPTRDELNQLCHQAVVGGFVYGIYWSSTEHDSVTAWGQPCQPLNDFVVLQVNYSKWPNAFRVRAVRAF